MIGIVVKITFLTNLIINLQKRLIEWDSVKRSKEWQWLKYYDRRSRAFLNNDISANDSPIKTIGPTPPPSLPPTPPRSGSSNTRHSIYSEFFEAKDVVNSFDNLIDEYQKLVDNDEKKRVTRNKRSSTQRRDTLKFDWRCVKNLNDDDSSSEQYKGAKFLAWGGRVKEEHVIDPENKLP